VFYLNGASMIHLDKLFGQEIDAGWKMVEAINTFERR
jgi:hypothetical protein